MGRNIDSQVSDQYQEDRPWLESDQRRKTKCFPLGGVDKPKSCRRWSPVRVVFTRTTSIFQPAIRNNLGIRFERERERRARFSTLERWVVPFERWSKDRSILDKRVYKNSSLEIASIVWHQGTNHLWRCGAAGITSSSWKPARDTLVHQQISFGYRLFEGDLWSWTGRSDPNLRWSEIFVRSVVRARGCSLVVCSCDMWHGGVRRVWWEKGLVATTKDSSDGMTLLPPLDVLTFFRR